MTLQQAIELAGAAVRFARENQIGRLLVDGTRLTGFDSPALADRYVLAERLAGEAMGTIKLALLVKHEMIHPRKFGILVARNRGLRAEVFDSEDEALAWLLDPKPG